MASDICQGPLRLVYTNRQRLTTWNVSVNVCIISDQLGLKPIFGTTRFVYEEFKAI